MTTVHIQLRLALHNERNNRWLCHLCHLIRRMKKSGRVFGTGKKCTPLRRSAYDQVHRNVVRFGRNGIQQLEIKTNPDLYRSGFGQQPVVIPFAVPQPVAATVEAQSWNHNQPHGIEIVENLSRRLPNPETRLFQTFVSRKPFQDKPGSIHNGKQNTLFLIPASDQGVGRHFARQRPIERNDLSPAKRDALLEQCHDTTGSVFQPGFGLHGANGANRPPQLILCHLTCHIKHIVTAAKTPRITGCSRVPRGIRTPFRIQI